VQERGNRSHVVRKIIKGGEGEKGSYKFGGKGTYAEFKSWYEPGPDKAASVEAPEGKGMRTEAIALVGKKTEERGDNLKKRRANTMGSKIAWPND